MSAVGRDAHTPSAPKNCGKMIKHGKRNINWRVSERNMAWRAMPILWKKLPVTICIPMIGKNIATMRIPRTERSMSSVSDVKMRAISPGVNSHIAKPRHMMTVAQMIVNFNTLSILSILRAP